jgi:SecD/SecF fusion protein
MRTDNKWRLLIVAAVTLISIWLIVPTIEYFVAVSGKTSATPEQLEKLRLKSVPLGLDLQGGVDVLLAIDTNKTRQSKVEGIAEDLRNRLKRESPPIDAMVEVTSGTTQIALTVNRQEQVRAVDNILTQMKKDAIFPDYSSADLKTGQKLSLEVNKDTLEQDLTKTIESSLKVIRERVDKLGVTQPSIARQGADRIRVQIPGEKNPEAVVSTIIRPAKLEFRGVHVDPVNRDSEGRYHDDSMSYIDIKTGKPVQGKQIPPGYMVRPMEETSTDKATGELKSETRYVLVRSGKPEMTGAMLKDAWVTINDANLQSPIQVALEFTSTGARRFEDVTRNYVNKPLAVLLDEKVYSAPNVRGVISEGHCVIEGNFSQEEAKNLSLVLKAGALPAEMVTKEKRIVEATLGADSIRASVQALAIGGVAVAVYMALYYGVAGIIADFACLINVLLILAFMKLANATLTLSGIGGILLTIGMAVDANVLIYERIREELHAGKSVRAAISLGFGRAFSVIFDANLTTLISGLILLQFGSGSVKGFALALNVGIVSTLFTGLFCTRALVDWWFAIKNHLSVGKLQWFKDSIYIDFVKMRKFSFTFSSCLFIAAVLYVLPFKPFHGSNWGVDFEGGLLTDVQTTKAFTTQQVAGSYDDWKIQKIAGENKFLIRTKFVTAGNDEIPATEKEVISRLNKDVGAGNFSILGHDAVGNEVGKEFTSMALMACILASIGILIYMAFRFEFAFGFAAVVALFHDIIITYGLFNMLGSIGWAGEVTLDVVSALLVILGYSVNDTIVIFDRVRENMKLHPGMPFKELLNRSICESLNRTVMTVSTVVIVLLVMLVHGGAGLYDFALVLLIGIIKGTYSSSFVASPILYELHERARRKGRGITRGPKKGSDEKVLRPMMREKV